MLDILYVNHSNGGFSETKSLHGILLAPSSEVGTAAADGKLLLLDSNGKLNTAALPASFLSSATGRITFTGTPTAGDSVTVNVNAYNVNYIVQVGDTTTDIATAIKNLLNANVNIAALITASSTGNVVILVADGPGAAGNTITYSAVVVGTTIATEDGTTLTGGGEGVFGAFLHPVEIGPAVNLQDIYLLPASSGPEELIIIGNGFVALRGTHYQRITQAGVPAIQFIGGNTPNAGTSILACVSTMGSNSTNLSIGLFQDIGPIATGVNDYALPTPASQAEIIVAGGSLILTRYHATNNPNGDYERTESGGMPYITFRPGKRPPDGTELLAAVSQAEVTTDALTLNGKTDAAFVLQTDVGIGPNQIPVRDGSGNLDADTLGGLTVGVGANQIPQRDVLGNLYAKTAYAVGDVVLAKTAPSGGTWVECDGSSLTQATHPTLYSVLGLMPPVGAEWDNPTISGSNTETLYAVASDGASTYVAVGGTGQRITSTDGGVTWTVGTALSAFDLLTLTYGSGQFVSVQTNGVYKSADGLSWSSSAPGGWGAVTINGIAYGAGLYVVVGNSGTLYTSPDANTWTARTSSFGADNITHITYGGGKFIAVGANRKIAYSADGITWTQVSHSFTTGSFGSVVYGNGKFLIIWNSNRIIESSDGITWSRLPQTSSYLGKTKLGFAGGVFVALGTYTHIMTSTDGRNWTVWYHQLGATYPYAVYDVAYSGSYKIVVVGSVGSNSSGGVIWTSDDYNRSTHYRLPVATNADGLKYWIKAAD